MSRLNRYGHCGKNPGVKRAFLNRIACELPTEPGLYFWDAHGTVVDVYKKPRHKGLFVLPPCGKSSMEIKITPRIAGTFVKHREAA